MGVFTDHGLAFSLGRVLASAALAVSVAGCSWLPPGGETVDSPHGCTLETYDGMLTAVGTDVRFSGGRWGGTELRDVRVIWPRGWTTRGAADGEVEVLDARGNVAARTRTPVRLSAASDTGSALMQGDAVVACAQPFAIPASEQPTGS